MKTKLLFLFVMLFILSVLVNTILLINIDKKNKSISNYKYSIENSEILLKKEKFNSSFYKEYADMYQNILIEKGFYDIKDTVGAKYTWDIESGEIFETETLKTVKAPRPKIYIRTHRGRRF